MARRLLITGGAGFAGSNLALHLKQADPNTQITCLDNLRRRGSELNLPILRKHGIEFLHGDVRQKEDLDQAGPFDALVECSAEPSVHAGLDGDPGYLINSNLMGAVNCFEAARQHGGDVIFLSSSRVYAIPALSSLPLQEQKTRLDIPEGTTGHGWSYEGLTTAFEINGHRSLYGASKLSAELLLEEYRHSFGVKAITNRFGVLAGPGQMGKVDQGFLALWAARHAFGGALSYLGFGGKGKQVRDILHILDMCRLVQIQLDNMSKLDGALFNAGGGRENALSLQELTHLCQERSGREIKIDAIRETAAVDIPWYITDNEAVKDATGWSPQKKPFKPDRRPL